MKTSCLSKQEVDKLFSSQQQLTSQCQYLNTFTTKFGPVDKTDSGDNITKFIEHLHKFNLYESFESIFKGKEVCYKLVQKFIKVAKQKRNVSGNKKKQFEFEQNNECIECNKRTPALEVDHIIPLYQGGDNSFENLQALCATCHKNKTIHDSIKFYDNIQQTCHYLYSEI